MKILLSLSLVFFLTSCSAIQIEQYPNANINYKEKSQIKNGISILAQAIAN